MNIQFLYQSHFRAPLPPAAPTTPFAASPSITGKALAVAALVAANSFGGFVTPPATPVVLTPAFADAPVIVNRPRINYSSSSFVTGPIALTVNEPWGWITQWPTPPLRNTSIHPDFSFNGFGNQFSPFKYDFVYVGLSRGEIALTGVLTKEEIEKVKARDRARERDWQDDDAAKAKLRSTIQDAVDGALGRKKGPDAQFEAPAPIPPAPRVETEDEYIARMLATLQHLQSQFDNSLLIRALREMRQQELEEEADIERLLLES